MTISSMKLFDLVIDKAIKAYTEGDRELLLSMLNVIGDEPHIKLKNIYGTGQWQSDS